MDKDREFMEHLMATFRIEADEHLGRISSGLIDLEKTEAPERRHEIVETLFREVHSLKGAARSVRLTDTETFCQAMEGLFAALKRDEVALTPELFDLLHQATDFLREILSGAGQGGEKESKQPELVRRLKECGTRSAECGMASSGDERGEVPESGVYEPPPEEAKQTEVMPEHGSTDSVPHSALRSPPSPTLAETVRVATAKLSSVLLQAEEMLSAKLAAGQRVRQVRETGAALQAWKKEWSRALPPLRKIRSRQAVPGTGENEGTQARPEIAKVLEFLDWNSGFVAALDRRYAAELRAAKHDSLSLDGMVGNLLEEMKRLLMFPFSSLLESFPRVVRELSRDHGKDADLVIRGGEIEIDRRVLEEMKDPLVHMLRNCIDHGIETPEERRLKNKPERGTITVAVAPRDDKVEIIVADDGAGISADRVRSAVRKLGLISPEKAGELADRELLPYVFQSGVSTSPIITELSGRGLGLAIVREKVEKLGGTVSLETEPEGGTRFRMVIPLTVATFRGILVRVGERLFVAPTMHVARVVRLGREEIGTVENREAIRMNGEALSLARLADVLGLPQGKTESGAPLLPALVLTAGGTQIAFLVDEVLGEQEVLLKALGRQLSRVRNVAGATVLGSGKLVPILNVPDLLKSAVKVAPPSLTQGALETGGAGAVRRSVLIAEDSITTRTLLRNILEAAGYDVVTAVDGVDALTRLKSTEFDIVVSDVDMPRMNGFDLTARIRGDKKLEELPVVLVTALESREDRERGIDVGASAYIVKSSFDQSNLLEVIKRLV